MISRTYIDGVNITVYPTYINNITSLDRIYLSADIFVYDLLLDNELQTIEFTYDSFIGISRELIINIVPIAPYPSLTLSGI